tara:strand:- start:235 stop:879 length:645 start_codon:yes stop_codon:yes gene_type:complete
MYLIDETYLTRELSTPNTESGVDIDSSGNSITEYIDKYARLLLQNALGNVLFATLDGEIEDGNLKEEAPQKWKDLVDGTQYDYSGETYTWKGLRTIEGAFKESVLAYYVYYHYFLNNLSQVSSFGEVKASSVNSENVNPSAKLVATWNKYVKLYQGDRNRVEGNLTFVKGVPFYDYYSGNGGYVDLIQFLEHKESDYLDAAKKMERGYLNLLGV